MIEEKKTDSKEEIKLPLAQELVAAGAHFGHKTSRWHPKMKEYIFSTKGDIHVFDMEKTLEKLAQALVFMKKVVSEGGIILFVGTKPVARSIVKQAAQELDLPYVVERWLGGTLTNFKTITKRLQYWRDLEEQKKNGEWEKYVKKERLQLQKRVDKLQEQFEGIRNLTRPPQVLFVADVKIGNIAIREAKKVNIPVVAICDSNTDPTGIGYPIPANDDASPAIRILLEAIVSNLKDVKPIKMIPKPGEDNEQK